MTDSVVFRQMMFLNGATDEESLKKYERAISIAYSNGTIGLETVKALKKQIDSARVTSEVHAEAHAEVQNLDDDGTGGALE